MYRLFSGYVCVCAVKQNLFGVRPSSSLHLFACVFHTHTHFRTQQQQLHHQNSAKGCSGGSEENMFLINTTISTTKKSECAGTMQAEWTPLLMMNKISRISVSHTIESKMPHIKVSLFVYYTLRFTRQLFRFNGHNNSDRLSCAVSSVTGTTSNHFWPVHV